MGDLSWNPASWTPSNLAEEAVEFITGSEGAGDIAGLFMASATGDVLGVASQSADLGTNVMAGASALGKGILDAFKSGFESFSNPGSINEPSAQECKCGGYAPGDAASSEDLGTVGNGAGETSGADEADKMVENQLDNEIANIIKGSGSLEDKIFQILMKMQKNARGKVEGKMNELKTASDAAKAGGDAAKTAPDKTVVLQELQQGSSELAQLTQLSTGLMQNFKQMKDSVIQNIR